MSAQPLVIWKIPLFVTDCQDILVPIGAQYLDVQMQGDQPCVWILCDPNARKTPRRFRIIGTGNLSSFNGFDSAHYVGTFQHNRFVWHLFTDADGAARK